MNIQWYPGHMTKARRQMQEDIKLIDLVIELVDARLPLSSKNPDIDKLANGKARLILMNKADLADETANKKWSAWFEEKGFYVLEINSKSGNGIKNINSVIAKACKEKIERDRRRGILNRPVRAMVVGIPNVGKSTFINAYAGKACAKTGNKPGVTKGKQWIKLSKTLELLDTPGILWPKFEDEKVGLNLAISGSINDDILNIVELSTYFISFLRKNYNQALVERYDIDIEQIENEIVTESDDKNTKMDINLKVLEAICVRRGCIIKGGEYDYEKAANILIDDYRLGRLGRITLELPG